MPLRALLIWECWLCEHLALPTELSERRLCARCEEITPRHITRDSEDEELQ
jgi:hypothetical protein